MAKKKSSPEEETLKEAKRIKDNNESRLKDLRILFLPKNPTYSFEPEEEVIYGGHDKCVVKEKFDDGLIYSVEITNTKKEVTHTEDRYVSWIDLRKKGEWGKQEKLMNDDNTRINYMQQTIYSLLVRAYQAGVDMNPEYQREHVWSMEDKINLIESIMCNIDIGKFVFVERSNKESNEKGTGYYEILDGKQRLSAILEFHQDRFSYKGKVFSTLHGRDRAHFDCFAVSVAELSNLSPEQRLQTFVRLNTAGRIMDKEHLDKVKKMIK